MQTSRHRPGESGFSFVELLIAITITVIVMTIVYLTLDLNSNVARVQTSVSELQQGLRYAQREMARRIRMTGRSGLPRDVAIEWQQNVGTGVSVAGVEVAPGTDILTVRGAFSTPIWRVDAGDASTFQLNGDTATIIVDSVTKSGFVQPVAELADAPGTEAIMIVSRQSDNTWAVAELANVTVTPGLSVEIQNQTITVDRATITVNISRNTGTHTAAYLDKFSPGQVIPGNPPPPGVFPANLTSALYISIIEEYKYFIQNEYAVVGDANSLPTPKLVVARIIPGTDPPLVYGGNAALASQDVAENIIDLQVALGYDRDADGRVLSVEDDLGNPILASLDEWRFNDVDDDPDDVDWASLPLHYLRVSLIGRGNAPDPTYVAPPITTNFDHEMNEATAPSGAAMEVRRFRRRQLENLIDLRNI
jgi:prepilin-type N-terminal cleavage/methylation domain-containing protein